MALYLLKNVDGLTMKIGISIDPRNRILTFSDMVNKEESIFLDIESELSRSLERLIHSCFSKHSKDVEIRKNNGYTEWFDIICFDKCISIVDSVLINCDIESEWQSIKKPVLFRKSNTKDDKKYIESKKKKIDVNDIYFNIKVLFNDKSLKYKRINGRYLFTFDISVIKKIDIEAIKMCGVVDRAYETVDTLNVIVYDDITCNALGINVNYIIKSRIKDK